MPCCCPEIPGCLCGAGVRQRRSGEAAVPDPQPGAAGGAAQRPAPGLPAAGPEPAGGIRCRGGMPRCLDDAGCQASYGRQLLHLGILPAQPPCRCLRLLWTLPHTMAQLRAEPADELWPCSCRILGHYGPQIPSMGPTILHAHRSTALPGLLPLANGEQRWRSSRRKAPAQLPRR